MAARQLQRRQMRHWAERGSGGCSAHTWRSRRRGRDHCAPEEDGRQLPGLHAVALLRHLLALLPNLWVPGGVGWGGSLGVVGMVWAKVHPGWRLSGGAGCQEVLEVVWRWYGVGRGLRALQSRGGCWQRATQRCRGVKPGTACRASTVAPGAKHRRRSVTARYDRCPSTPAEPGQLVSKACTLHANAARFTPPRPHLHRRRSPHQLGVLQVLHRPRLGSRRLQGARQASSRSWADNSARRCNLCAIAQFTSRGGCSRAVGSHR